MAFATRRANTSRRRRRRPHPFRLASLVVLMGGLYLLATFAYGVWHGYSDQQKLNAAWSGQVVPRHAAHTIDPSLERPVDGVDFAIRVPRLDYFAAVREGIDWASLYSGPGHYPNTTWPGEPGTVGVAAHNVYWINFPQLNAGDEVDVETRYGVFRYHVTGSAIVNPDNLTVLVPNADGYFLTLTTCWPLWAGALATQRYVIFAKQVWPTTAKPGYF